jgi:uncharacterized protein
MILKALLIGAVIYIVYIMFFKQKSMPTNQNKKQEAEVNEMVECAQCGVYIEISEAILSNGKYYCSKECIAEAKR